MSMVTASVWRMRTITGDLLELAKQGEFDVIAHGCNCMCQMGKGIALSIRREFPEAWEADRRTRAGDRAKLGTYTHALVLRGAPEADTASDDGFTVVNAYTQYHWRGASVLADYDAIRSVFTRIASDFDGQRIGYPLIGAGLAGGDWEVISAIIEATLAGQDHTLVRFATSTR